MLRSRDDESHDQDDIRRTDVRHQGSFSQWAKANEMRLRKERVVLYEAEFVLRRRIGVVGRKKHAANLWG
jgi:hypothetical protein